MSERLTGLSAEELEDFFLLLPRILCDYRDPRRGPFEMLYLYGETTDNDMSGMLRVIELANAGATRSIGIADGEIGNGFPGFDGVVERLKALGWNDQVPIVKLDNGGNVNTLSEARALVSHARAVGGDIGVVAPAFHLPRAFTTTVSALDNHSIRLYAICGVPLRWNEHVVHSQGILKNARAGLLADELKRMEKYRAPEFGSMLSAKAVLQYLAWRDNNGW